LKKAKEQTVVYLTGGLGNQLFQLACGLYFRGKNELLLDARLGKPRKNNSGLPEITSFALPESVSVRSDTYENRLVARCTNFMLRQGISPRNFEKIPGFFSITKKICAVFLSFYYKTFVRISVSRNIGFSEIDVKKEKSFLLGYFQTYIWASDPSVKSILRNLSLSTLCNEVEFYKALSISEKPLVVHFRLGDYLAEEAFGLPSTAYYKAAISEFWKTGKYNKIWAFSDEPEKAQLIFSDALDENIRWIPDIDNSAAKTLEVMRFGHGYIIANSTFSWWGAFLTYQYDVEVIAPIPWFRGMADPAEMIPPHWKRLSNNCVSSN
jgi:hypothetical protein